MSTISKESFEIIANKELIAVNQDPKSPQAQCLIGCSWWSSFIRSPSVYVTTTANGDTVAAIVNWREVYYNNFSFTLADIGMTPMLTEQVEITDLYE